MGLVCIGPIVVVAVIVLEVAIAGTSHVTSVACAPAGVVVVIVVVVANVIRSHVTSVA